MDDIIKIKKPKNWYVITLIVLCVVLLLACGYFVWAKYFDKTSNDTATETTQTAITTTEETATTATATNETAINGTNNTSTSTQTSAVSKLPVSTLTSIDETWNLYKNNMYNFTMKIPKQISQSDCELDNTTNSYRMTGETTVPVTTFEDGPIIYISGGSFKELTGGVKNISNDGGISWTFSGCKKTDTTLAKLKSDDTYDPNNPTTWPMLIKISMNTVKDDAAIESYIQKTYAPGCKLGEKKLNAENTYDVAILSDGLDLETTTCGVNYWTVMKYSPVLNLLAKWNMGQDSVFTTSNRAIIYDKEMVDSFKFDR